MGGERLVDKLARNLRVGGQQGRVASSTSGRKPCAHPRLEQAVHAGVAAPTRLAEETSETCIDER